MGEEVWFRSYERQLQGLEQASPLNGRRMRIEYIARKKMPIQQRQEKPPHQARGLIGYCVKCSRRRLVWKPAETPISCRAQPPANGGGSIEVRSEALAVTDDDGFHLVDPC